ncbi:MAG: DUF4388 domain-containing protein [Acidobacteriota bacterium]
MNDQILLSGKISEIRLPTLLMSLYRDRETGILTLTDGLYGKSLFIEEGKVVYASSEDPDEGLGECLLRRGAISLDHFFEATAEAPAGQRLGELLVTMGALTSEELLEGVSQRLYDIIFSLFEIRTGSYSLELASFSTMEMTTLAVDLPLVVMRGMERLHSWSQIRAAVGEPSTRVRMASRMPPFVGDLDLSQEQEHLLSLSRTGRPVSFLVEASYLPPFQTYKALWIFLTLGLMEKEEARKNREAPVLDLESALERYNDLYAFAHLKLGGLPDAEARIHHILRDLGDTYPDLVQGQAGLAQYGRLDPDQVLWALRSQSEDRRAVRLQAFLEEVLYAMAHLVESSLPAEEAKDFQSYILQQRSYYGGLEEPHG